MKFYPLHFIPIPKQKIWGGNKLKERFNKDFPPNVGESWELSCLKDNVSIIKNGEFAGQDFCSIINRYPEEILGKKVMKNGGEFPLLFKLIDAKDNLSIQVHPGDDIAKAKYNSFGKTEMWFILDADKNGKILCGFNKDISKQNYPALVESGEIENALNACQTKAGDVFFIPTGRVHAIGAGVVLAEIQQTSDLTFRIFDYNRTDEEGKKRKLHINEALDVLDLSAIKDCKTPYVPINDEAVNIVKCQYFTVNFISLKAEIRRNLKNKDSFVVYMSIDGTAEILFDGGKATINKGETVLIPANIADITLKSGNAKLLETYI
ncbi:MAG: class I mannose-6-phosphate isomerase [Elusimicrobiota bacterium]|nr:class I mannose-6-phosphate isomerase [Elusimicrobiota bacterium]